VPGSQGEVQSLAAPTTAQLAERREHVLASHLPGDDQRPALSVRLVDDRQDPELAAVVGAPLETISFVRDDGRP
jgi:hypothetical protein